MSFDFVMDAFPAYTKFDKTHKCLCALQVIGGEQGEAAADDSGNCPDVRPESYPITEVVVGYDENIWKPTIVIQEADAEAQPPVEQKTLADLFGLTGEDAEQQKQLADILQPLGRNLSADINALDIDFSGTLASGFSFPENSGMSADGYYIPVAVKSSEKLYDVSNVDGKAEGDPLTKNAGDYSVFMYEVDQNKPVQSIKAGDEESENAVYYAFDFSNINFA